MYIYPGWSYSFSEQQQTEREDTIAILRKEVEFFQSALEQARSELTVKRIEEGERAREHEDAVAVLTREHEKRASDLRLEIAEHRARAERLESARDAERAAAPASGAPPDRPEATAEPRADEGGEEEDAAASAGGGGVTPATVARLRQKVAKMAASEEGLRIALEAA